MRLRIYTDTSVLGGCEDDEFRNKSTQLLGAFRRGDLTWCCQSSHSANWASECGPAAER